MTTVSAQYNYAVESSLDCSADLVKKMQTLQTNYARFALGLHPRSITEVPPDTFNTSL